MPMPAYPTIVVPGVTASYLEDGYSLPPETVWSVLTKEYERIALHPDDVRYEAIEPARVAAGQVFEVAYKELIAELRHNLRSKEDLPVPVFPFAYDWRQPLAQTEQQLAAFIDEVIERTKLLRHYDSEGYATDPRVNLVGHSMGGLIIAGYLARSGADHRVHKVATLATPFQGSYEAVIKVTTGTADLGGSPPSSREREAARLTPSLYQLLPSFPNVVDVPPGLPRSLFDPQIWQPSIVDTIREFIRLRGLDRPNADARAKTLFADLLRGAVEHRARIDALQLDQLGLAPARWLCVVGVDSTTRTALTVTSTQNGPAFVFHDNDRQNQWQSGTTDAARRMTGDGTVPFAGALPRFLPLDTLVCVTPDDFGYWEVQDRVLAAAAGFHGILPNMDMLHRLIVAHFTDRPGTYGNIWGHAPPGVPSTEWRPPIPGLAHK